MNLETIQSANCKEIMTKGINSHTDGWEFYFRQFILMWSVFMLSDMQK